MKRKPCSKLAIAEIVLKPIFAIFSIVAGFGATIVFVIALAFAAPLASLGGEENVENTTENLKNELVRKFTVIFIVLGIVLITVCLTLAIITLVMIKRGKDKKQLIPLAILDIIFGNPMVGIALLAVRSNKFDLVKEELNSNLNSSPEVLFETKVEE